jgi:hypothetical protein
MRKILWGTRDGLRKWRAAVGSGEGASIVVKEIE